MRDRPDDIDRLQKISPADEFDAQPMPDRLRRPPRMIRPTAMVLLGIGVIVVCGVLLLFVVGLSSFPPPTDSTNWPISVVLSRTFGLDQGGLVAIPALCGFLAGVVLFISGLSRIGKPEL